MHRIALLSLTVASLFTGACALSDRDAARSATVTIDTLESGTIQVRNSPPADRFAAPRWVLEEELRIGTVDGAGPDLFGAVKGIEVDDEGRIYVLESQAQEIRVFGPDGAYLFTFGRQGEGPGEFKNAHGLARAPDGRIWVPDPATNRYSVFEPDGRLLTSFRTRFMRYGFIWCCGFGRDGMLYDDAGRDPEDPKNSRAYFRRFDANAEMVATYPEPDDPPGYTPNFYRIVDADGRSSANREIPFSSSFKVAFDPRGGFLTALTDRYRIVQLAPQGDTLRIIEAIAEPVAVSAAERDTAIAKVNDFAERFGGKLDLSKIPGVKPILASIQVDDADRLWVRLSGPGDELRFDVFDAEGRFLGAARAAFTIPAWWTPVIRGDYLYTLVRGELDEPYLVRARIRRVDDGR